MSIKKKNGGVGFVSLEFLKLRRVGVAVDSRIICVGFDSRIIGVCVFSINRCMIRCCLRSCFKMTLLMEKCRVSILRCYIYISVF